MHWQNRAYTSAYISQDARIPDTSAGDGEALSWLNSLSFTRSNSPVAVTVRNILYVTSWMPTLRAGGTEQRSTNNFLGLAELGRVHVLHLGGNARALSPALAAKAASLTRATDIMNANPGLFRVARQPTLADRFTRRAWGIGGLVFRLSDREVDAVIAALPKISFDAVFAFHLPSAAWIDRVADRLAIPQSLRIIDWDFVESSVREFSRQRHSRSGWLRHAAAAYNAWQLAKFERGVLTNWGLHLCAAEVDKQYLLQHARLVQVNPNCATMPKEEPSLPASTAHPTVLFVGTLAYWVNADAVKHFLTRIWPTVRMQIGSARFMIVGRSIPDDLMHLSGGNGVTCVPNVSELAPFYREAHVVVAPMRYGVGSSVKIIEALAYRRPLICFPVCGERHQLRNEEHFFIARSDDQFADMIIKLIKNPTKAAAVADAGYNYVRKHLSQPAIIEQFRTKIGGYLELQAT